ncbi:hypothetical protein DTO166G4_7509 [Paecilomyces variotii]|uniref:Tetraspanin n=1 Tax=Byssochlamys spectabilis TaxID=264951 RepID=A0A443HYR0_BYSSP|nr:tetraspanin [Paecilomyces variotii]KAJ9204601.1 hypothetical protein DTO164E3_1776 [Paecilomyces variotii]KAJ9208451.1 hypothetical protein DTO032I3_428 [Paecilomyces variotii]KAJ9210923.1 hypothetical protein DTO166G4_7509 [Paecilomyces variotii]KAJ9218830.1 hypothetical protein DTO169C6_8847 [Paecilomyces variotii]KAJ9239236.1 hypothetical protein DTO166G5_2405 [Paecilomyces variotii]
MANGVLLTFFGADLAFLLGGVLLLVGGLVMEMVLKGTLTVDNVDKVLLLQMFPIKGAIVNAIFVFITFVMSLLGIMLPGNRFWLKCHGYFVWFCAIFTMILGLDLWFQTLQTRANLDTLWGKQTAQTQSLLQQKFDCCGYTNSTSPPFIQDSVCTTPLVAAQLGGCATAFTAFANPFLDIIFTADFGIVAIDMILLLCVAVVVKDRKEKERYRLIDAKNGFEGI